MVMLTPANKKSNGFTIIEVLIVLSIVGLILLIVFLAVPSAMRSYRNYSRKHYAEYIAGLLDEYKSLSGHFVYDGTGGKPDERCTFINSMLQSGVSCTNDAGKNCQYSSLSRYDICFHPRFTAHSYMPPLDEMSIAFGHICNTPLRNDGTTNPIMGNDTNINQFAIWIKLESAPSFCVDNGG